jgi:cytochrome b subunit of formate dehydrogenase
MLETYRRLQRDAMNPTIQRLLVQLHMGWCQLFVLECRYFRFLLVVLAAIVVLRPPALANDDNKQCLKCHGESWIASMRPEALAAMVRIPTGQSPVLRDPEKVRLLFTPAEQFNASAHGSLKCTECHLGIERLPHNQRLPVLSCSDCHKNVKKTIAEGPHGTEVAEGRPRPTCTDCHGPAHEIKPVKVPRSYETAVDIVVSCERCHNESETYSYNPVQTYNENIHGQALFKKGLSVSAICTDCHGSHAMLPPSNPQSPIHPFQAPKTCGKCHEGIEEVYLTSVHGQHLQAGDERAASCTTCHPSHGIRQIDKPFLLSVVKECSHCHTELGASYLRSYHGKATTLGYSSAAVCSSCHGAHDILPKSDPRSNIAPGNIKKTCGKCHENVNDNFVKYIAHVDYRNRKANPQVYYVWLGMTTLLLSVLAVFIVHTLLWFQRSVIDCIVNPQKYRAKPEHDRMVQRFHPIHRVTHALIIISFMGLVATGFPLKYSYAEWAKNLASLLGGIHTMRVIHRVLAVVTLGYVLIHISFLIHFFVWRCPRPRKKYLFGPDSLIPSWRDFKDFWSMIRWFLWLGPKPRFDRWTYFEKFDYWGETWGVIVIGGSGLMLWLPTLFTRWLPGWVINCAMVVHSIEALLAASIIFLVHFFNTHLRPEKFPVDLVMLTGQMTETEIQEERPDEYERLVAAGELEKRIVKPATLKWRVLGTIGGIAALLFGIMLIILAIKTELSQIFR